MKIHLTPRLENIISHVTGSTAADIGCDHAYVPIELVRRGICKTAIASDARRGPAEIAAANISRFGLSDKIEVRVGNGLDVLSPNETETVIIAGMGGELICDIIDKNKDVAHSCRLVLQPMNAQYELRHYLVENGFKIIAEDISVEGFKVYNLIEAQSGESTPFTRDGYYHVPPYLRENKYFSRLFRKKMREFDKVISGLEKCAEPDTKKIEKYRKWKNDISDLLP